MKVVVNSSGGGFFEPSPLALIRLVELKNVTLYIYWSEYRDNLYSRFVNFEDFKSSKNKFDLLYSLRDLGEICTLQEYKNLKKEERWWFEFPRDDSDLVRVIEELGSKKASLRGNIEVAEIPDGIEWEILTTGDCQHEFIVEMGHYWGYELCKRY